MKIEIKGYITSKKSELYSDCADNYEINTVHHKFAISDGVSKSFFPKIWSEILVNKYVNLKEWKTDEEFIIECQKEWQAKIDEIVNHPETKWFTKSQYNRKDPALATFVGLQFFEKTNKWIAHALGDSFLFFIPKDSTEIEVQLSSKSEPLIFDNFPDYLSSIENSHKGEKKLNKYQIKEGTFYLMTDALAEWFIQNTDQAIQKLKNISNQEQFLVTIENERNANLLNDDDSAVLIIDLKDDNKKEITYSKEEVTYLSNLVKKETEDIKESKKKEIALADYFTASNTSENNTSENIEQEIQIVNSEGTNSEGTNSEGTNSEGTNSEGTNSEGTNSEHKGKPSNTNSDILEKTQKEKNVSEQIPIVATEDPKTKSIFDKF